jgi:hypothetical protein
MKKALGKIVIFIYFGCVALASPLATYTLTASKNNPKLKEGIEIKFSTTQQNRNDVMFFFLEPKKSPNYKIVLLKKEVKELAYHHKKATFSFLLFALKSGSVEVGFDFMIKTASDKAVAQVYEGGRDNVKWIDTKNTKIKITPLTLQVKKLSRHVDLVGDFQLKSTIDKKDVDLYDGVNLRYTLSGVGYDEIDIEPIEIQNGVKIFAEVSKHNNKTTKDGYDIDMVFNYALILDKSLKIKTKQISCYSPKTDTYYTLKPKFYDIKVSKPDIKTLIDKDEFPKQKNYTKEIKEFFIYLLIFTAGYLSAKFMPRVSRKKNKEFLDIKGAKNAKELLYTLMHRYHFEDIENFSKKLEKIVYLKNNNNEFKKIKHEILTKFK